MWGTIPKFRMLLPRLWKWPTTLDCEMPSLSLTIHELLVGFTSVGWSTAPESIVLGLSDFSWSLRLLQPKQNFLNSLYYDQLLHVPLSSFQITHGMMQCTACQHSNYHNTTNQSLNCFGHIIYAPKNLLVPKYGKTFDSL